MRMQFIICPHLKGSCEGAVCAARNSLIKDLETISIKLCMTRHYEVCAFYRNALLGDDAAIFA